jgi:hypothetical protein
MTDFADEINKLPAHLRQYVHDLELRVASRSSPTREADPFYTELGRAIAAWQVVELGLSFIFLAAVSPKNQGAAGAAFEAVRTTDGKLEMVDAALQATLKKSGTEDELWKKWRSSFNRAKELGKEKRNRFAHYLVLESVDDSVPTEERVTLNAPFFDAKQLLGTARTFRRDDLVKAQLEFYELAQSLLMLAEPVGKAIQRIKEEQRARRARESSDGKPPA